jgi:hypothetical protein
MAIAFDAASGGTANSNSITYSHTCTGANRILFVSVGNGGGSGSETFSVTYAGVSMTSILRTVNQSALVFELFYLVAPATGANNVVVSTSKSSNHFSRSSSYTGASQTGVPDSSGSTELTSTNTTLTVSSTSVADNCWHVTACETDFGCTNTAGTGLTIRSGSSVRYSIGDSNSAKTPPGSVSLGWNFTSNSRTSAIIASFKPVASGPAGIKTINGITVANTKTINGIAIASVKSVNSIT